MSSSLEVKKYKENRKLESYNLYLNNKLFRKVRAVVRKGNNFLVLCRNNSEYWFAGGGVDAGETIKQACEREVMEELGIKAKTTKYLTKSYYTANMEYNGIQYKSKRVEYIYLCDCLEEVMHNGVGLTGEYDETVKVLEISKEQLFSLNFGPTMSAKLINALKKVL